MIDTQSEEVGDMDFLSLKRYERRQLARGRRAGCAVYSMYMSNPSTGRAQAAERSSFKAKNGAP